MSNFEKQDGSNVFLNYIQKKYIQGLVMHSSEIITNHFYINEFGSEMEPYYT